MQNPKYQERGSKGQTSNAGITLEQILGEDFVPIPKVYEIANEHGMTKAQVRREKQILDVKTAQIEYGNEKMWLWYLPEKIWQKYHDSEGA